MAKKGQNFNKYNDEFRNKIVNDYFSNLGGVKSLAKKYGISYHTIQNWVNKIKNGQNVSPNNHLKGRKKDSNIDYLGDNVFSELKVKKGVTTNQYIKNNKINCEEKIFKAVKQKYLTAFLCPCIMLMLSRRE